MNGCQVTVVINGDNEEEVKVSNCWERVSAIRTKVKTLYYQESNKVRKTFLKFLSAQMAE